MMRTVFPALVFAACTCVSLLCHAAPESQGAQPKGERLAAASTGYEGPKEDLHVYLLIGQSNMAGRAKVPEDMAGVIERCYLLNDKGQWVPAKNPLNLYSTIRKGEGMQKLGPGYSFAIDMLKANPDIRIGLVVNARGGSKVEDWLGEKSKYYKDVLKRVGQARQTGTLKGVLWHQGESNSGGKWSEGYSGKVKTLVETLREDMKLPGLPFVAGEIKQGEQINEQIGALPKDLKHTAVASSKGLKTYDRWHFDTKSTLLLGQRYAEQMIGLHAEADEAQAEE